MMTLNRRKFIQLAASMGAPLAWGGPARASTTGWHQRRDLYPEGVASGGLGTAAETGGAAQRGHVDRVTWMASPGGRDT